MSILKLQSHNEVDTILKLKGVHKTLSNLCDHLGWSLKLTNDILYNLPEVRNSKFKHKLCNALPTPITEYLNRVIREHTTDVNLHILDSSNSPSWVSQVISESSHFTSCLSFGLRKSLTQSAHERLSWVKTYEDVSTVYHALWHDSVKGLHGFTNNEFKLFKEAVQSNSGCNRCYLLDELIAFKNDDVRYLVLGSPFDFRNHESQGYQGRARLIRYGDDWLMDTVYGNLGVSRTKIMNWLTDNGYGLLVEDKDLVLRHDICNRPNNPDIYINDDIFPRAVYECKPVDYTGILKKNSVFFDRERIVTELVKPKQKVTEGYHAFRCLRNSITLRDASLCSLHILNKLVPGAVKINLESHEFMLTGDVGDYNVVSISVTGIVLHKYKGNRLRLISIDYSNGSITYGALRSNGVRHYLDYSHLSSKLGYGVPFYRVFTRIVKRLMDSI